MIKEVSDPIYYDDFDIHYYDDGKPPKHKWGSFIAKCLIFAALMFLLAHLFYGCGIVKKLEEQHAKKKITKLADRYPNLMAAELTKLFPPSDSSDYSIGTTDTTIDPMTVFYKHKADSLKAIKQKVKDSIVVNDTCETIGSGDYDEGYNYGVQLGYAKGKSECKPSTVRVDTLYKTPSTILVQITTLQNNNDKLNKQVVTDNQSISDYSTLKWYLIGGILLALIIGVIIGKVTL